MYLYIAGKGHRYATLASGVSEGNMLSGLIALEFLETTAGSDGIVLNQARIDEVRNSMALAYLNTLDQIAFGNGGIIDREIKADEAWEFHNQAFRLLGFSEDSWTVNTPFTLIENQSEREQLWSDLLRSDGRLLADGVSGRVLLATVIKNSGNDLTGGLYWLQRMANRDVVSAAFARLSTEPMLYNPTADIGQQSFGLVAFYQSLIWDVFDGEINQDQVRLYLGSIESPQYNLGNALNFDPERIGNKYANEMLGDSGQNMRTATISMAA